MSAAAVLLEHARAIARQAGLDAEVASAYGNLGSNSVELFHLEQAERYLADGHRLCRRARPGHRTACYMVGWLAVAHLYRGRWPEAAAAAAEVLHARRFQQCPLGGAGRARSPPGAAGRRRRPAAAGRGARARRWRWGEFQLIGAGPRRPRRGRLAGRRPRAHAGRGRGGLPAGRAEAAPLAGRRAGLLALAGRRRPTRRPTGSPRRSRSRSPATGARRPRPGSGWAAPTKRPARWPMATTRRRAQRAGDLRAARRAAGGGRPAPRACAPAARRASRAARGRPRARTASASPPASWRSSTCWPRAEQRRDRRTALHHAQDGGPPRLGGPGEARRPLPRGRRQPGPPAPPPPMRYREHRALI